MAAIPDIATVQTDVLVIGGGIAGHRAALAARQRGADVLMAYVARGASPFVIGCNVPTMQVQPKDSPEEYAADMIRGGYGLNDQRLVRAMVEESIAAFDELASLGVPFARDDDRPSLRHLSGNTYARSVYVADGTGRSIMDALGKEVSRIGITVMSGWKALRLLKAGDTVVGALLWRQQGNRLCAVHAKSTVLAAGGIGRLYDDSTYPADVSAGSYGVALEAGARLVDMEFVQFEPVVTVWPEACRGMEMPTAMLGDGAHLLNAEGERFMLRYNPGHGERQIEKARMALCIQQEIDAGRGLAGGTVLFDTRPVPRERLESYVSHCRRLRSAGLDPAVQGPLVRPAAHSQMGGIHIDANGWSGVPGLYAAGEAAGGVHGASRIAGNGCSDTVVFGGLAGRGAAGGMRDITGVDRGRAVASALNPILATIGRQGRKSPIAAKSEICRTVSQAAPIWRTGQQLQQGATALLDLQDQITVGLEVTDIRTAIEAVEAMHMVLTARTIVGSALQREESRGAHQRVDFPKTDNSNWLRHVVFQYGPEGVLRAETVAIQ
ncbi:FAD-binding protein [Acidisphaera sp. L21]|uniref:FAD-binding protein n=1 Tax=Acidisphaera sp. L21 TaxID=1641851 RepID=UPI001C208C5D|nr:FAD-binding protein [Acidisphaera sp. L21]